MPLTFIAYRPFLFVIHEKVSSSVLFLGKFVVQSQWSLEIKKLYNFLTLKNFCKITTKNLLKIISNFSLFLENIYTQK